MRFRSTLLFEPLSHPLLDFILAQNLPGFNILEPALDLLANVDMVLNDLKGDIVRDFIEHLANDVFRGTRKFPLLEAVRVVGRTPSDDASLR